MSATVLTVTEAARHFSEYISRVAYRNETFVLSKGRKPMAELRPIPSGRRLGDLPAILRSVPHLTEADADAFAEGIDAARHAAAKEKLRDPWES